MSRWCNAVTVVLAILFAKPPVSGQVLRYTFDETMVGTLPAADSGSAPAAAGTFAAGATRVANPPGRPTPAALDLTVGGGVGNFVSAGDADKLDAMPGLTIAMWLNFQGNPSSGAVLAREMIHPFAPGEGGWALAVQQPSPSPPLSASNFALDFGIYNSSGSAGLTHGVLNADHQWLMVAATFDSATRVMRAYAGGVSGSMSPLGSASALPSNFTLSPNSAAFTIGSAGVTLPAWIDDVHVFDRALTGVELEALRASTVPEPSAAFAAITCVSVMGLRRRFRPEKGKGVPRI